MSCSKCGSVSSGCGCKDTAYTTPKVYTCPPDTSCPQPVRCSEFLDAACVFLNDGIADAGIQPGSSLESIIQQLILLVTNPGCVDAPGGVPGGGTVTFIDAIWPGNAITIAGGPISNSGTFVFNGNGTSLQYIDGQGNLQTFPSIGATVEFQTNGTPNSTQVLLNLVAGQGVTLTESGGSVVIDIDPNVYTVDNGLSIDITDSSNFQLGAPALPGAPLIHDTYIAGAQFRFEINNTNSMFLQGNRVDIEGAAAGAMLLSTGGTNDNSVEVDSIEVAIESVGQSATTKIFLDPLMIKIQTPLYALKNNNDVLTLINNTTGEVEFMPPTGILLQTDGVDNPDQTYLNLISGNGIVLTNINGDVTIDGPLFQTDGTDNSIQTLLNLVAGTGITLTETGGSVTIDAAAPAINLTTNLTGGAATYNSSTGDLNIPIYNSQIDIQDEGLSETINPTVLDFVGAGVTVVGSGSTATITIPGGGAVDADNGLIVDNTNPNLPLIQLGGPSSAPAPLIRDTFILTTDFDFDISGVRATKPILQVENTGAGTGLRGRAASGIGVYGISSSGYSGYFETTSGPVGLYSVHNTSLLAGEFETISTVDNTILPVLRIKRSVTGATAGADGIGSAIDFFLDDSNNILAQAGSIIYEFTDSATGATDSRFALTTSNVGSIGRRLEITSAGQLILNSYTTSSSFDPESGPSVGVLNVDNAGNVFVASGSALAIQVDGTPLSGSSLLNFVTGADIGVTDLGGGSVQFNLVNPPIFYDSNNGVYNNSDIFQLGVSNPVITDADFQTTRYLNANTHSLNISGPGNTVTSGVLNVLGGNYGIQASGTIRGIAGIAIGGAPSSYGGYLEGYNCLLAQSFDPAGTGITVVLAGGSSMAGSELFNGIALTFADVDAASLYTAAKFRRSDFSPLGPQQNIGIKLDLECSLQVSSSSSVTNSIVSKLFQTGTLTAKTQFEIQGLTNGVASLTPQFTILGGGTSGPGGAWSLIPGQIKFDRYAAGAIYKSAVDLSSNSGFNLGIDSNGNIWATDFTAGAGGTGVADISIGTLSNGASATVSNPSGPSATINITGQNAYTQIAGDSGTASANVFNSQFNVVGAQGITTSVTNGTSPVADIITVNGPAKYLSFVTKNISGTTIATYTPTIWNETLNIQAGTGVTITNGGSANTIVISSTGGGGGTGSVTNVSGTNANGFTFNITNPTTTPDITLGTSVTGILIGNGTGLTTVAPSTGALTYNAGTGTYSFTAIPVVNDGQFLLGATNALATGLSANINLSVGPAFTANIATNATYRVGVGPALSNLATYMTQALPANPAVGVGVLATRPVFIRKTGQDTYTDATPVTTFSPGTTGFTVTSGFSTATALGINENVVLGGVLNVSSGGTGNSTIPGNGQLLVGNGSGAFVVTSITGAGATTVTSGAGGIIISSTGTSPTVLNGLHAHVPDGSIRLGSGTPSDGDIPTPLIERTDVRLGNQIFRLSNNNDGFITQVGLQINDTIGVKNAFFGSSSGGAVATANTPQVAFIFSGVGGTALTAYSGVYIDSTVTAESKVYSGFSSGTRQVINRSAIVANQKLTQIGTWGVTADQTFYEAIPSARTIQIGSIGGNNNWIKLDDANQRVDINKATIFANAYGSGVITGVLASLIATDSAGKFFEFAGRSISQITGNTGTFSAASMASQATPVAFSIQGSGTISTSITGNVLTISGGATAFPYWSSISRAVTAGSTGTVSGATLVSPQVNGANNLQFNAGSGIGIRTVAAALGSATGSLIEITNNGLLSLSTGLLNAFTIVSTVGSPGVFTLNIPFQWRTINLTNTAVVPVGSTTAASILTPNIALSDITFNGGPGVTINTNTTSRVVTISAAPGGNSLLSTNGVWQHPDSLAPTEYRLGSNTDGLSTFTQDRFINALTSSLQIKGTPATGDTNGILKLLSSGPGRGLRVQNTNVTPDGAIYAISSQPTSSDTSATGTIYSTSNASPGSAIVGVGTVVSAEQSRPAIFGRGYIGIKGFNNTGQVQSNNGRVAGGIGVYGASVYAQPAVPGDASPSVWGVVGSTVSNTNMLLGWVTNTGTGVYGEATGAVRSIANLGTGSDLTTFAGRFVIKTSGNTALPTTTTPGLNLDVPLGIRSMVNVGDVLQVVRLSSTLSPNILGGIGGAIVFNIESNGASTLADGDKAGRIGYKLEVQTGSLAGNNTTSRSRFFVTTKNSTSGNESERFAIRSSGQTEFSAYAYIDTNLPPNINSTQGVFIPELQTIGAATYANFYDYSLLGVKTRAVANDESRGRVDTLRTRHGQFLPVSAVIDGVTGIVASTGLAVSIISYLFSSLNSVVTCHISGNVIVTSNGAKTINFPLPLPALNAIAADDISLSWNFNTFTAYTGGFTAVSVAPNGTLQRCTITLSGATATTSTTYAFSAIITYITYN